MWDWNLLEHRMLATLDPYSTAMTCIAVFALILAIVFFVFWRKATPAAGKRTIDVDEALDAMQVALWEWDWDNNLIEVNDAWLRMHGYARNEIEPITFEVFLRLIHPDDVGMLEAATASVKEHLDEPIDLLYRILRRDGTWLWITSRSSVVAKHKDGTPKRLIGGIIDVSKAMDKEREKNATHQLMDYVIQHSKAGIAVFDKSIRYVYVSEAFFRMYGINPQNAIGRSHYDDFPDLPEKWREAHRRALQGHISQGDRDPYPHADGHIDITRWECRPWRDASGEIAGIVVYTEVINDIVKREQELEASRNFLKLVMDHLPIGISINTTHPAVEFSYLNDLFAKNYGTTREALSKSDGFWEAVYEDPQFREQIKERVLSDIESGDPARMKWENVPLKRKGKPTRYINGYSTRVPEGNLVISSVVDVTEEVVKRLESEYNSTHDFLTGLLNRRQFSDDLDRWKVSAMGEMTLMMLDINGLKTINDAFGFTEGDAVIRSVAQVLRRECEGFATAYRVGGDEFAVILGGKTVEQADALRQLITDAVGAIATSSIPLSVAIGFAVRHSDDEAIDDVIKQAESFMYKRKIVDGRSHRNSAIKGILQTLTDKFIVEKHHSEGVARYCKLIGHAMGLPEEDIKELEMAGLLHDIGKITVADSILTKEGKLTEDEYESVKNHASRGYQILRTADEYSDLAIYCLTHHEHFDGTGYPSGLKGAKIPLFSRIIAVADTFEAMTSDRPYRKALDSETARNELRICRGTQFDPAIVEVFLTLDDVLLK